MIEQYSHSNRCGNTLTIEINHARDDLLTDFGKRTLADRYLLDGETPQHMFARVAVYYADDEEHAERLYDYMSRLWFMPATPILSNGGTGRGNPISCFLNSVPDSLEGINGVWSENVWLAAKGGGIGTDWSRVRSIGEKVGDVGKTSGIIPFIRVQDSLTLAISQGSLRRGSAAVYLDVDHPEIEEFIDIRRPTGDPRRRAPDIHHGVNITDVFMEAVRDDENYDLKSPKTGEVVRSVSARKVWTQMLQRRMETGEPYMLFIDTVQARIPEHQNALGLKVRQSNLCVAPETKILTDQGHVEIASVAGSRVNVWNGEEFSEAEVFKTGENQALITVTMSDGSTLECTPYHKFYVESGRYTGRYEERRANELTIGDRLIKWCAPVIEEGGATFENAYRNGFFTGDGTYGRENPIVYLYGEKRELVGEFAGAFSVGDRPERLSLHFRPGDMWPKFTVPHGADIETRLEWLAGLADADGCVARNGDNQSLQITSVEREFVEEVRLLLQTCGVNAKVAIMHPERVASMPDGRGGHADFERQAVYRLLVNSNDLQLLRQLGFAPRRLKIKSHRPQRSASHFVTVTGVMDNGRVSDTYCFTEPKRHMGVFNGVLTGQCSEITLPTGEDYLGNDRTAVCCLSSLNLERYLEWSGNKQFIRDTLLFLDSVLQDFIDRTDGVPGFEKARYSAMMERSIGLGVMGFHSFLQKEGIPFEGVMAKTWNKKMFGWIRSTVDAVNTEVAQERGACPDAVEANKRHNTPLVRWSNAIAVAPTASISVICGGVSAGIEPVPANSYTQKTLSGSFSVKNVALNDLLREEAAKKFKAEIEENPWLAAETVTDWLQDQWASITQNEGSVQRLDFLTQDQKDVFKTAFELDQAWLLEHMADRAHLIHQAASNNVFLLGDVNVRTLHQIHFKAWERGVKSLYYLRSKSVQRAESEYSARNMAGEMPVPEQSTGNYDECLSCQ